MGVTRRTVLLSTVGLLAGCASDRSFSHRPGPSWPDAVSDPSGAGSEPTWDEPDRSANAGTAGEHVQIIGRGRWTSSGSRPGRVNQMGEIDKITVHHEGWKPVHFTGWSDTVSRLERIRRSHVQHHGWGDIGYHYIIDRAGRVWEGRPLEYQGAHVKNHNPHNIGVMVLGNFERQSPAQAQLDALVPLLRQLMQQHNVGLGNVHTHRELGSTSCPGRNLQPKMVAYRRNGTLA
jgi:hypothetical protein